MWNPFKRSKKIAQTPIASVRMEAEDLLEQGFMSSEVAAQLNITPEEAYRIKNAKRRRDLTSMGKRSYSDIENDNGENPIEAKKRELAEIELQDKIDEAKHKSWLRQREREDAEAEDYEDIVDDAQDSPDKLFTQLLINTMAKGRGEESQRASPNPVPHASPNAIQQTQAAAPPFTYEQLKVGLKTGFVTEEKVVKELEAFKVPKDKAKKLYEFMKEEL